LRSNHRLIRVIFQHKMTSPPERPFSHYIHAHCLATEMWTTTKNNLLGKKFFSCSFYLYRFCKYVSYGFAIINFCNPGVHYETPCILQTIILQTHIAKKKWETVGMHVSLWCLHCTL